MLQLIRRALGWADIENTPTESCVLVVGHTSYYDGVIAMLYRPDLSYVILMKSEMFEGYWSCLAPLFRWFGFIPAPKERGAGGVQAIVDLLRAKQAATSKPLCFLISPKGTILNRPWRSGYRHIAEGLGWPIKVQGADFSNRTVRIVDTSCNEVEPLQAILSNYCTLIPENTEYPLLCDYDPCELTFPIDVVLVSNLAMLVPGIKALAIGHVLTFAPILASFVVSWNYHLSRERDYRLLDSVVSRSAAAYLLYTYPLSVPVAIPAILGYACYWMGAPRIPTQKRGQYIYYHALFHVIISLAVWMLIV
jgi:1-acyl-sn-glycerol-3-phosphate acyltransferase